MGRMGALLVPSKERGLANKFKPIPILKVGNSAMLKKYKIRPKKQMIKTESKVSKDLVH